MIDFNTFTKISLECGWFGQINCCQRLLKVAQSPINRPIWSHVSHIWHYFYASFMIASRNDIKNLNWIQTFQLLTYPLLSISFFYAETFAFVDIWYCFMVYKLTLDVFCKNIDFKWTLHSIALMAPIQPPVKFKATIYCELNYQYWWAVVVAQLVEWSLPIPEVRGSNPVIGKNLFIYWTFVFCQLCVEKTKIKKKIPEMGHLKKPYKYWKHP